MKTATKDKAERYYGEMKKLAHKITNNENEVKLKDFERLEKLFRIGGISEINIQNLYENCGFESWKDYLAAKKYCLPEKDSEVSCVDDQIWLAVRSIELNTRHTVM